MAAVIGPIQHGLEPPPRGVDKDASAWDVWRSKIVSAMPFVTTWKILLTPASFATPTSEQIFPLQGLQPSDIITINKPSYQAGLSIGNVRCSSLGNLAVTFVNNTGGAILPVSENYLISAVRL